MRMSRDMLVAGLCGTLAIVSAMVLVDAGIRGALIWLPIGAASAVLVRFGNRMALPFASSGLLAALALGVSPLGAASGIVGAVVGPWLLACGLERRGFRRDFARTADVLTFVVGTGLAMAASASWTLLTIGYLVPPAPVTPVQDWLRWWLTASVGTLLVVPASADVSWRTLQGLARRPVDALLMAALALLFGTALLGFTRALPGVLLGPASITLVMLAAIRFDLTVAAGLAGLLTAASGASTVFGPYASATTDNLGLARAWAFGLVNIVVVLTVQALRAERTAAEQALSEAERAYTRDLLHAASREQQRIGQELHDALGQELTGLALLARGLERKFGAGGAATAGEAAEIAVACSRLQQAARGAINGMLAIDAHGGRLDVALHELVGRMRAAGAPTIELSVREPSREVPRQLAECIYRVAQEALTNAVRHAGATRIRVFLERSADQLLLRVCDDGHGVPAQVRAGLGTRNMQYRAEIAGGTWLRRGLAGGGTVVELRLPWRAPPPQGQRPPA